MHFILLLTLISHCFILSSQVETSADVNGEARTLSRSKRIFASAEAEKTSEVEEKVQIYKNRIKELENELAKEENEMKVQEKYQKKIELARNKFLVELHEMVRIWFFINNLKFSTSEDGSNSILIRDMTLKNTKIKKISV